MRKIVQFDPKAIKELENFSIEIQARFYDLFSILSDVGRLEMPFAKKLNEELFEIRVKQLGQWRATYAYISGDKVIVLSAFQKKSQKTPDKELKKALKRLKKYRR